MVKNYLNNLRTTWNEKHNIKINNHDVEVYIQDKDHPNRSHGIYSILKNVWLKEPKLEGAILDKDEVLRKYRNFKSEIVSAISSKDPTKMKLLVRKITDYRNDGLATTGEFGLPNVVYKLLRKRKDIEKLYDAIARAEDAKLSLTTN